MKPRGETIVLENTDDVCTVGAVIGAAFLIPNVKLRSPELQARCNRILARFTAHILGEPLTFPQTLNASDKEALKVAADVTAEHAAKAVGIVNNLEAKMGMSRETVFAFLALGNEDMLSTALLADDATIEATAEVTAVLSEADGPQPPSPKPPVAPEA